MQLQNLYDIIEERKKSSADASYTASLFADGIDRIAQKVGEEAVEVVIASKNDDRDSLIGEIADLQYHLLVLMSVKDVTPGDVASKLAERHTTKTTNDV